jgi:hypothetical protein
VHMEVLLHAEETRIADIGSVKEAEPMWWSVLECAFLFQKSCCCGSYKYIKANHGSK